MGNSKKARAAKRARPAADHTCTVSRAVERRGLRLVVWTCSAPAPRVTGPTGTLAEASPPAPTSRTRRHVCARIGRRRWRFFFVDPADASRQDADLTEPGWYVEAARASIDWLNNDPVGPYQTLKEARDDVRLGESNTE